MAIETVPEWMAGLEDEDVAFIKKFLLASGSLKEVAGLYGVTYPTVRLRLDRLIQKIHLSEDTAADPYVALVKRLAVADKLDFDTAKLLISDICILFALVFFFMITDSSGNACRNLRRLFVDVRMELTGLLLEGLLNITRGGVLGDT